MARKYTRDNRGRFASVGATARGGRLATASGKKRETQTAKIKGGAASGTIGKPKGLKPGAIKAKPAAKPAARRADRAEANIPMRGARGRRLDAEITRNVNAQKAQERAADKARNRQAKTEVSRAKKLRDAHIGSIAKAKGLSKAQVESALKAQPASTQIKALKNWVKVNRAAAKPAAAKSGDSRNKATTGRTIRGQVSPDKALRVSQRINAVTNASSSKTGIKRLNAIEVGVRAKAFATRKIGGMGKAADMNFQQQQAAVRAGLSKPSRYSTQKPNRNKPGAYNNLGQTESRRRLRAADNIMRNSAATSGRAGNAAAADTARQITASTKKSIAIKASSVTKQPRLATKAPGAKAPSNARTQANRLRTAQNRVRYFRQEPDAPKFQKSVAARNAALAARTPGTPGKIVFRSKNRAVSRQNMQANDINKQVRYDLQNQRRGQFSATGGGGRIGIRRTDTGNRQPSLLGGKATKLYKTKRVQISRPSGKSRRYYR